MNDSVVISHVPSRFNVLSSRVVSVDPQKYSGPIYHYSWMINPPKKPTVFGTSPQYWFISLKGHEHVFCEGTSNIIQEAVRVKWPSLGSSGFVPYTPFLLDPVLLTVYTFNAFLDAWPTPTRTLPSSRNSRFAEWERRDYLVPPGFISDNRWGGVETRHAIDSENKSLGPVGVYAAFGMNQNIEDRKDGTTDVTLGVNMDCSLVVYSQNDWGQTMAIQNSEGFTNIEQSLDDASKHLSEHSRSSLKHTTRPFICNLSQEPWDAAKTGVTDYAPIECFKTEPTHRVSNAPFNHVCVRGLPLLSVDICAEPGDHMQITIQMVGLDLLWVCGSSEGTLSVFNRQSIFNRQDYISMYRDRNKNGIGENDEQINPYETQTFDDLSQFLIRIDHEKLTKHLQDIAGNTSNTDFNSIRMMLDCQAVSTSKNGNMAWSSKEKIGLAFLPKR